MDYKYYVYVGPGHIYYFDDYNEAIEIAEYYGVEVKDS